jgi:hypothetical protein
MVEKVARALEDCISGRGFTSYEDAARAAIEAMREPTVAMHKAGTIRDDGADPTNAKGVYSVMIDAALKD